MTRTDLATSEQVLQDSKNDDADDIGGDDVVTAAIDEAEEEVLGDYGDPPKRSTFVLDSTQTDYEFRIDKRKTFAIEKVYILTDSNIRREYTNGEASESSQTYRKDLDFNKITFAAATVLAYDGNRVIIDYIPNYIHWLVRLKAALHLIDRDAITNAEEGTPVLGLRILQRIDRIEKSINTPAAVGSEDEKYYDPTVGEVIPQRRFRRY